MLDSEIVDDESLNEDSYDGLVSLIEASKGVLSLLIASCKPGDFQTQIINRYEAELAPNIPCYRVVLNQQEPSLRAALEQLVQDCPELKEPHASAVITVTGTEALMDFVSKADSNNRSELNRFFGYLQWTREGLREFPYPIVIWVAPKILSRLSLEAPDFWSWRSGVFRFVAPAVEATGVVNQTGEISLLIEPEKRPTLPLDELLEQVENLEQQTLETPALATLYNRVANAYANRVNTRQHEDYSQEIDRAIHFFEKSLVLQRELNFRLAESDTLLQLGDIYRDLGLWERVFDLYEQSLAIARNFKDSLREAAALGRQGNLYQQYPQGDRANNLEGAIASYTAALIVYTRDAFPEDWAMTQNNLAVAYSHRVKGEKAENIEQSMECYQSALCVYTRDTFPEKWAMTQNNVAIAYSNRIRGEKAENIEMAIASYNAALTVYSRDTFPEKWAMTQNNLGNAYSNRIMGEKAQNIEMAIVSYNAALSVLTRDAFPEKWAATQNNLAIAYSNRIMGEKPENIEMAIASCTAALSVLTRDAFPEKWAMTQNNLGLAYSNRIMGEKPENIELAIASYTAALTVYTRDAFPEYWAMTQNNLGEAYRKRIRGEKAENIELATKCYKNALTIRSREAFPQNHTETLSNLGCLYQSNKQWQLAYDTYIRAIEIVEVIRGEIQSGDQTKQKLAEEWNHLYLNLVEVCIELQSYTEAVEYAERSKGQNLIELLSVKGLYPKGEIPPEVRQELQQLRRRIAEENQRLKQAEEKNYDFINQLRQGLLAKYPYTPLKFADFQQLADEKTAIVEWYILGKTFCVFIITNHNLQPQILRFSESDLDKLLDWVDEYLGDYLSHRQQWQNSLKTKLANLAQILHIDEIVNAIPETCDQLILIPHRYLHLFPLHALPVTNNSPKYLIDAFPGGVSYAPSCQLLHQVQKYKRGKFDKLFAIQNPTDDLITANMEVETIKNIFPNSEIIAKQNAKKGGRSESKLEIAEKAADSDHLFFSCHSFFDRNNPLQSGLLLADGTLTLEEIIRYFNLSECSLVTLSASETGLVQLDNTDEYISFTSAFLLAGSPSLYVSLWSVNTLSTAILMIKTYENLSHQPGKFALSLNQAQIWMRDTDIQGFLDWTNQCHLLDQKWRDTLQRNLNRQSKTEGTHAKIYQNPFYWAGFCAAGKGEQNMTDSIGQLEIFQRADKFT
jgi:CHAT domain-containing protein